jgi:hypothetical protein
MSQPNRRNALALVATLPALAAPAAAAAMGSPDAELLRLGEQLDQVIADYNAQQLKDRADREPFEAMSLARDPSDARLRANMEGTMRLLHVILAAFSFALVASDAQADTLTGSR